jgi:D-apionolactonase
MKGRTIMIDAPSRSLRLYGTDQPVTPPRTLQAGPLTVELEAGNLRYIRYGGVEMIRSVSFIVRDRNWGTYEPTIDDLVVDESADGFRVTYSGVAKDESQAFAYSAEIVGRADGTVRFSAKGHALTDFLTNRTGFVVLHPAGVAGKAARVTETTGRTFDTRFPELIDPVQPMMNLRAIAHEFDAGSRVECRMEGDTFEMEDQRNWTDASYKTYVRPLALPWPYTLRKGETLDQSVSLAVTGAPHARLGEDGWVQVALGEALGPAPALGIGLDPEEAAAALAHAEPLRTVGVAHLICHYDPRRGHGRDALARTVEVARSINAAPWLEAIVVSVDGFEEEVAALGQLAADLGSPFPVVLVSPAPDLKCTLPDSPWPPCPPAVDLYRAARRAFPHAELGGGMFSYFTELNRKRPPLDELDFVSFTTSALVHAGDDRSVAEGLESLPHIARSVRAIVGAKPYAVGPSAIGMRDNPYGQTTMANPGNIRQAMNRNDPRQRGLLGAAWSLAYFSHFAVGGARRVALGGAVGPFGLLHTPADFLQPWFDEAGGLFPVYHVVRGLGRLRGAPMRALEISAPREIQGFSAANELWLANLMGEPRRVRLGAVASGHMASLDAESFVVATQDADALGRLEHPFKGDEIEFDAYAVIRLRST